MAGSTISRYFRLTFAVALIFALMTPLGATAQEPGANFSVDLPSDNIFGWEWVADSSVTIDVDDPGTPGTPDLSEVAPTDGSGHFDHHLGVDVQPGFVIDVTDGFTAKSHIVIDLAVADVDVAGDTATGTAPALTTLTVHVWDPDPSDTSPWREVKTDGDGNWFADFSVPGDGQGVFDIVPTFTVMATQADADGDRTQWDHYIPNRTLRADPVERAIFGDEWLPGSSVAVTLNGADLGSWPVGDDGYFWIHDIDTAAGDVVTGTDGTAFKDLEVQGLSYSVDPESDRVFGTADPGEHWQVGVQDPHVIRNQVADASGDFVADFGVPGDGEDEQDIVDIAPGTSGSCDYCDEDQDCTIWRWYVPRPIFRADPQNGGIWGHEWYDVAEVTISIDGTDVETVGVDESGDWGTGVDPATLSAGTSVTVTGEGTVKTLVLSDLAVTLVDEAADAVLGSAATGSEVWVEIHDQPEGIWRRVIAGVATGDWMADFTDPVSDENGEGSIDFAPGVHGAAFQEDDDGDTTWIDWRVREPRIGVEPQHEGLWGNEFDPNSSVDITINGGDYGSLPTDEWGNWGEGWDPGDLDIQAGDEIIVTDTVTAKTHIVTPLAITTIDIDTDEMSGTALPDHGFSIWVHDSDAYEWVVADSAGDWTIDWTDQVDIVRGSNGNSQECDDDGDCTWAGWNVPNPSFAVETPHSVWSHGEGWVEGRTLTLVVDDDEDDTNGTLYTDSVLVERWGPESWEVGWGFDLTDVFEIVAGHYVAVDDGVDIAKALWVEPIQISEVNEAADTISGTASPSARVEVNADTHDHGTSRSVDADAAGNWVADFSVPGDEGHEQDTFDIGPGTGGGAQVFDGDGDSSHRSWNIGNPAINVEPQSDGLWGDGWAPNGSVDITVGGAFHSSMPTDGEGNWGEGWDPMATDLVAGMEIEVSDGATTKLHTVTSLAIADIDISTEIMTGTATGPFDVWVHDTDAWRHLEHAGGAWSIDWSIPASGDEGDGTADLERSSNGNSNECDDDGDCTWASWSVPNPSFSVERPFALWSTGEGWVEGRTVTFVIDDDDNPDNGALYTGQVVVERWGPEPWEVGWSFDEDPELFEILPGYYVSVDDGVEIAKALWVDPLEVTDIDEAGDAISGIASAYATVEVHAGYPDEEPAAYRTVTADGDGFWVAEFADPEAGEGTFDIEIDTTGAAQVFDDDGDSTHRGWFVEEPPMPGFLVRPDGDEIWGDDWLDGPTVTITIDNDDDSGNGVLFETEVEIDDGELYASLYGDFDIVPGHYIVVTGGEFTKDHWVTDLMVTDVDVESDMVHGTAEPGSEVLVGSSLFATAWEHVNFQFGPDNRNPDSLNEHLEFRRAVAHAIDRDLIVAELGKAAYPLDSYVDAYLPELSQHAWSQYPYDPAAAAALIDGLCTDLGRDCAAEPPVAVLTTSADNDTRVQLAELLVPMLGAAGIEVQLELEDETFFDTIFGRTGDLATWAWVGEPRLANLVGFHWIFDPEERFDLNFYSWGTPGSSQVNDATARMAELIGLMEATDEPVELEAYIAEAEQILADETVIIPLFAWDGGVWGDEPIEVQGPYRVVEAGPDGAWTADFSMPWEDEDTLDIVYGTGGFAEQPDDDGDATRVGWQAAAPSATVEGHVYLDGAPLPDVEVWSGPDEVFTCTDADGYFRFDGLSPVEDAIVATGPAYSDAGCGNTAFVDPDGMPLLVAGEDGLFLVDGYEYLEFNVEYAAAIQYVRVEDVTGGTATPVDGVPILAFDRNDEEFVDVFGHDPDPADYPAILESGIGGVAWIDWTGAAVDHEPGLAEMRYPYVTDVLVLAELDPIQGAQSNADEFVENLDGIVEGPEIVFQVGEAGPVVTADDVVMYEGDRNSRLLVTLRLSEPVEAPVTVTWTTVDGSALAGEDYVATSGTVTFRPGTTERTLRLRILGDTMYEDDESFEVVVLTADGAEIGDPATVTLLNDDAEAPELSVGDVEVTEGDRRRTRVGVPITLSGAAAGRVTFTVTTVAGTASPGEDFVELARTFRIRPGSTSATIYISVIGDTVSEGDETFTVEVSDLAGATLGDGIGEVTILNDD